MKKKKVTLKKGDKIIFNKNLSLKKGKETVSEGSLKESQEKYGTQEMIEHLYTPTLKQGAEGIYSCFDENGVFLANSNYEPKTLEVTFLQKLLI